MSKIKITALMVLTLFVLSGSITIALADPGNSEGSLNSGYSVTSNWHGIDVPMGSEVNVTAMTTNSQVDKVTFIWKNPANQTIWSETVPVHSNGTTYNGKIVYYASSIHTPQAMGDWGVQAKFYDQINFCHCSWDLKLATRATSFNVVPEIPLLGTAGAAAAMVLGLTLYKKKSKPI